MAIRNCSVRLPDRMHTLAEGGDGRSTIHEIPKLAHGYPEHRQEAEIVSVNQLPRSEVRSSIR